MKPWFEGTYYKHQKGEKTLCFIVGRADGKDFVQVISQDKVWQEPQGVQRTATGLVVNLPTIHGTLEYGALMPLQTPIMGPFQHVSMECNHWIESMRHRLTGGLWVDGVYWDFTGGVGYIEGDKGRSFPKEYLWIQCNDFPNGVSLMVAVAEIPVKVFSFTGCVATVLYRGEECRFATYKGVRIQTLSKERIVLKQGVLRLDLTLQPGESHPLQAPKLGQMVGVIHESNNTAIAVQLWERSTLLWEGASSNASFEWQMEGR